MGKKYWEAKNLIKQEIAEEKKSGGKKVDDLEIYCQRKIRLNKAKMEDAENVLFDVEQQPRYRDNISDKALSNIILGSTALISGSTLAYCIANNVEDNAFFAAYMSSILGGVLVGGGIDLMLYMKPFKKLLDHARVKHAKKVYEKCMIENRDYEGVIKLHNTLETFKKENNANEHEI